MNAVIKGAKKGSGEARKAVIAPDSAQSKTYIKILYGLSEGEVEGLANGLQSVYLEETPLHNPNGGSNFQDIQFDFRHGTNDQTHIEGFPDISSETAINVELVSGTPWVRAISNTDLDAVRVRFKWGPLRQQNADNGDVNGITIQYAIDLQTDGGSWVEVLNTKISDKTSANYERSHRIDLPKSDIGWTIRVRRLTPNSTSEYISDKMYVDALTEVIDLKLSYPNTAMLGLQYDAETFSNVAKIAVDLKGIKLQVPANYDPVARTYTGMWDGTFKRAYTNNPAWIYYDICTSKRYALGDRLTSAMLDKWSLYRLAQYCDQLVDDGKGGQEPRFTCNVYLQSTEDAYTILSKLAGVFRAISYWDGNSIVCDADIPQDTYFTYTRANVIDGLFEYTGTRARDRHTVAKVAWDNPANHYKTEYVYVRDEAAIAKLGVRIAEIDAWGCTSEGQAQRAGLWALKSEQLETRTVSFKVGLDGYIPQPGRVIEIADELFAGRANGGRISAVSADRKIITLDRDDVVCHAGDRLVVNGEDGKAQARIVSSKIGRNVTVTVAFDSVAAQNVWAVDAQDLKTMKFRVMSITQDEKHQFSITALQYESAKYDAIDFGAFIDERPISIINPTIQAPVTNVLISSENMVQQGLSVETMLITWDQAQGATKYQVEWRKDDGSWIKLPITGSNSVEVQGIYAGNYEARVTAISAFDVASLPTYSILTTLSGKQGLPPALANITATGILFGCRLDWDFPAVGALDTAYTEIEIATTSNGANASQLGLFAYPTDTHSIQGMQPNLTRYFRGRLIDRIGNIGPWSQYVSATTSADAAAVLDILSGKITETQLHQNLQTEIAKIDENSIAISQEVIARAAAITSEAQSRATAISTEKTERQSADSNLSQRIDTVSASAANNAAAIQTEQTARANADSSLSSRITTVAATANAKNKTYSQPTAPTTGMTAGDLWFNTANNNKPYRYSGTTWVATEDTRIAANTAAITTEATARADSDSALGSRIDTVVATANSKNKTFLQTTAPTTGMVVGDLWFDTDDSNKPYRYSGTAWTAITDPRIAGNTAAITSEATARADADSALATRVDTVQSFTVAAQNTANAAQQAAEAAATAAGNKGEVIFGSTTPTAAKRLSQNLWIDTTGGLNTPKRWNGSAWVAVTDKAATNAAAAASAAQATATEALNKANTATQNIATIKLEQGVFTDRLGAIGGEIKTIQGYVDGQQTSIEAVSAVGDLNKLKNEIAKARLDGDVVKLQAQDAALTSAVNSYDARIAEITSKRTQEAAKPDKNQELIDLYTSQIAELNAAKVDANAQKAAISSQVAQITVDKAKLASLVLTESKIKAQYTIKLDYGGVISSYGLAIEESGGTDYSNFIVRADSFALAGPASEGSTPYYPFIFRSTPYTDPNTGTVFPVGAYMKSAFIDYASIDTTHIKQLAVKSAQIDNLAVTTGKIDNAAITTAKIDNLAVATAKIDNGAITTAKIGDLQVDTLKIKDDAVSVGIGVQGMSSIATVSNGGKLRLDIGVQTYFSRTYIHTTMGIRVLRNGLVIRTFSFPATYLGSEGLTVFSYTCALPPVMETVAAGTTITYRLQVTDTNNNWQEVGSANTWVGANGLSMVVTELKK